MPAHTVETYWNAILGQHATPESIVAEYGLAGQTEAEIRTFLDESEIAAVREGLSADLVTEDVRRKVMAELVKAARTADQWWAWHDQDAERHSSTMEGAEVRCAAWVAGESDDGPA